MCYIYVVIPQSACTPQFVRVRFVSLHCIEQTWQLVLITTRCTIMNAGNICPADYAVFFSVALSFIKDWMNLEILKSSLENI